MISELQLAPERPRRPTIQDVARLAGVSRSTVSNLLNNRDERMGEATVARIRQACATLGFAPETRARLPRRQPARIIGLVVPSVASPFWGVFARAVEEAARTLGFAVLVTSSDRMVERQRVSVDLLYQQGVRAIICGPSPTQADHLAGLVDQGMHVLVLDRSVPKGELAGLDCVTVDNRRGGYLATKALLDLGHRRIGFLSSPMRTASRRDRIAGYRQALAEAGVELDTGLVWGGTREEPTMIDAYGELGRDGIGVLVGRPDPPTAIVALNDLTALGVCAGARSLGRKVPEALSVIGFDDISVASLIDPPLSSVRPPVDLMAAAAVERLVARLGGDFVTAPLRTDLPPELVLRSSTAPPRG